MICSGSMSPPTSYWLPCKRACRSIVRIAVGGEPSWSRVVAFQACIGISRSRWVVSTISNLPICLSQLARRYRLHLSPRLRNQLIERCDGVPLYLQEICRRLDMERREGRSVQIDELPQGLLGLLASRIDQLDADREVAQIAAVLGRQFRVDFLMECSGWESVSLKQALDQMLRLEVIEPCTSSSEV